MENSFVVLYLAISPGGAPGRDDTVGVGQETKHFNTVVLVVVVVVAVVVVVVVVVGGVSWCVRREERRK